MLGYGSALVWIDAEQFDRWIREDGPVENLTALVLGCAALVAARIGLRWRAFDRTRARTWLLLGCLLAFGALEEVSWGQRVFGWRSPDWFLIHNAQGETNLHNLRFHGVKLNKLVFGKGLALVLLVYLGLLPLLYARLERVRVHVDRLGLPLVRGPHLLAYLAALALVRFSLSLLEESRAMEMGELMGCSLFLMMLVDPRNPGVLGPLAGERRPGGPGRGVVLRRLPPHVLLALALIAANFVLFASYRAAFWLAFRGSESTASAGDVARAFALGLRFDLRLATLLAVPLLALGSWGPLAFWRAGAARRGWIVYTTALAGACSLIYAMDFAHYAWVDRRLDVSVLEYAAPIGTALEVIWETYPVIPLLAALGLFLWGWSAAARAGMAWAAAHAGHGLSPRRGAAAYALLVPLLALGVNGRLGGYPLRWSHAFFSPDAFTSALGLNPVLYLIDTWPYAWSDRGIDASAAAGACARLSSYLGTDCAAGAALDGGRPIEPGPVLAGNPSIVVIQLESFGANKVGILGNPLDPTPNFDRLARESLLFTAFYTASRGTARSTFSLLTGIPDVTRRGSRNPLVVNQQVLVDEFEGYEKMYFYTGDLAWGNLRGLLQNNIAGLRVFEEKDYRSPRNDGWGISDLHLFEEANAVFRELGERPFIAFLHTSGNHRPYTIPRDRRGFESRRVELSRLMANGFRSQEEFDSLRFMDHSLGQFLAMAQRESYFGRTIFVILGDHGSRGSGVSPWQKIGLTAIHVPLLIFAPGRIAPGRSDAPASSLDVLPTLAALAGVHAPNHGLGRNLLAPRRDGESWVFSDGGLVDREFFYADGRLHRIHSADPTADLSSLLPERRQRMAHLWQDFHDLALYRMHHAGGRE